MDIQNYRAIDKNDNTIELPFKDWKEQSDAGVGYVFQVISDQDKVATYRKLDLVHVDCGFVGRWWMVDLVKNTITMGDDSAIVGQSVNYEEKVINCHTAIDEYRII